MNRVPLTILALALLAPALVLAGGPQQGRPEIKWNSDIDWKTWEEGSAQAAEEGKGICLVVYADWCPRCHELAPVFSEEEIVALADDVVMVLQDNDEKPQWLQERYGHIGRYVPRVLFLAPDGTLRTDLTGGNPKYPYYYWPGNERLAKNLATLGKSPQPAE